MISRIFAFLRYLPPLLALSAALPASATLDAAYATWQELRDPSTASIRFHDGYAFITEHPGWPEEKIIRIRTEAAAMFEHPPKETMAKFCNDYPPISGRGMLACIEAGADDATHRSDTIKQAWIQGDFNEDEESRILSTYSKSIGSTEQIARMDRLIYEAKLPAAKRMFTRLPADRANVLRVRIAYSENNKKAPKLLKTLSTAQLHDPGIIYERLRWHQKHGDDDYADLLLSAPKSVPYPALWWPMRATAARTAIGKRDYALALALVSNHGDIADEQLADALWLRGWLHLQHKNDAADAYKEFFQLYTSVNTPVSKARAAYWAARAAEKNGNRDIAEEWFEKAARYPTVFYGQLALSQLKPHAPLSLPKPPKASDSERELFEADERVAVIRMLAHQGDDKMRELFMTALAQHTLSPGRFALLADLATETGGMRGGVEASKLALRNDVVLVPTGWPRISLPENTGIEPALTLAITRQESQFDPHAISPADAQGLMQLLPGTAAHIARRIGLDYNARLLTDRDTNLTLGSRYLGQIIDGFDGSYILGIASYNAGPATVRGWVRTLGTPPQKLEPAIDWIESIPYGETRNYVMRVMENVAIYRTLANPETPLAIDADLTRQR